MTAAGTKIAASREIGRRKIAASREKPTYSRPKGYIPSWKPQAKTEILLAQVSEILEEYKDLLPLTIRQIFYRLVGQYAYPKDELAYERLCTMLGTARRARRVPFDAIRDDGVISYATNWYADPNAFHEEVQRMARRYERDKMARQPRHVELWCEAAGMMPQLANVANPFSVHVYSSGGFDSITSKFELAQRICAIGKPATILHVGDFDPSGVTIFRAVEEDVHEFVMADRKWLNVDVQFVRVALTDAQVAGFRLPTAPPKRKKNSHAKSWTSDETCQLEALAPDQLAGIVRRAILDSLDERILAEDQAAEPHERHELTHLLSAPRGDR